MNKSRYLFGLVTSLCVGGMVLSAKDDATGWIRKLGERAESNGNATSAAVKLTKNSHGQEAVDELGEGIDEVAGEHGITGGELHEKFLNDPSLWVDRDGQLYYAEEPAPAGTAPSGPAPVLAGAADGTFLLHSRPGSSRVIYLDFTGHVISGTSWNAAYNGGTNIVAPAWDTDGVVTNFGTAELSAIQSIWARVAEDYAPFDVDVTTEEPAAGVLERTALSDSTYGVRVVVSPISGYFGNFGGLSYVGVFNQVSEYYKPALVFPEKLANNEKYIAEACSHEAGHTLGLLHDGTATSTYFTGQGTGDVGWAPIMGSSYSKNLSQWNCGEYSGANNAQDDIAVMQTYGIGIRADDHGNSIGLSTPLGSVSPLSASGVIERREDVDFFTFTFGGGSARITVTPATAGPNLDVGLTLWSATGAILATANPSDVLSAEIFAPIGAGTYHVSVEGVGAYDPFLSGYSDYGSLGQYSISVILAAPQPPVAVLGANPVSGTAPLSVSLTGTQSYDPDGSIRSYLWNFGDGGTGGGATETRVYSNPGQYPVSLTVTDFQGLSATSKVTISVSGPNQAPVARIAATPTSGYATLAVSFKGTNSSDADGAIASYAWNFGDGTTGTGGVASKSYTKAGTYVATLTVTDNLGAIGSTNVTITVLSSTTTLRVASIVMSTKTVTGGKQAVAKVTVKTVSGSTVSGVTVTGAFSGAAAGSVTAVTDSKGVATLTSATSSAKGTVTFGVSTLSKSGYSYDATRNSATSAGTSF